MTDAQPSKYPELKMGGVRVFFSGGLNLTVRQCSLLKKNEVSRGCSVTFDLNVFREGMIAFVSFLILNDNYLKRLTLFVQLL